MSTEVIDITQLPSVDQYKLACGLVTPRPIGWIGSASPAGQPNLAPFSFFNVVCNDPMTFMFSCGPSKRGDDDGRKDTLTNVLDTGEFTVSIVSEHLAEEMNASSETFAPGVDEFASSGLTPLFGSVVAAPMVAEAHARFECRLTETIELGGATGPHKTYVLFGEAVTLHIDPKMLSGTRVLADELRSVGRMAGSGYCRTVDGYFELERP